MNYTTKTAVRILSEDDRENVIPFLESLGGVNEFEWNKSDIDINDILQIREDDYVLSFNEQKLHKYTILQGVPQNWREELH